MTEYLNLSDLKDSLGKSKEGVHSGRLFNYAIYDVVGTLILSVLLCLLLGIPWFYIIKDLNNVKPRDKLIYWVSIFIFSIVVMFLYAILMHRLFNVDTTLTNQVFSLNDKRLFFIILRIMLGCIFIYHGFSKLRNMNNWINNMDSVGISSNIAIATAWIEFIIGITLTLGIFTGISSFIALVFMLVAIYLVHLHQPILDYWYQISLLIVSMILIVNSNTS